MRLIDVDYIDKRRKDYISSGCAQSFNDMTEWGKAIEDAPIIETKEIKYFDETEKVWKIGIVIKSI